MDYDMIYGEYRFDDSFFINPLIPNEADKNSTMLHEGLHYMNAMTTPFGIFLYMLKKVNKIDSSMSFIMKK